MKKLKILATAYDYRPRLGGIATLSFNLLRTLQRNPGVDVRLMAPDVPGGAEFDKESGIPTWRVRLPGSAAAAVPKITALLPGALMSYRPDVLFHTLWHPSAVASFLNTPVRLAMGVPYFIFAHGDEVLESDRNWKKKLRRGFSGIKRAVFRGAAGVVTNSHFTEELVRRECGVAAERISVVHCGVDAQVFYPGPRSADLIEKHEIAGKRVILAISRLEDYKGLDRGISAMRAVIRKHPDAVYLICGEGQDRPRLEALVRHYGLSGSVRFAGSVPFDRLKDYHNLCEVHALLTRSRWETPNVEGFGLVILEAAACGKASIGGASGGIPEVIVPGETGWLVNPHDDREIADAMIAALGDPERTCRLGSQARERAQAQFTWDLMAEKVLERLYVRD